MAQELSANETLLMANQYGKFVAQNLALSTFKRSKDDWKAVLDKRCKKSALAKDFLADIMKGGDSKADMKRPAVKEEEGDNEGFVIDKTGEYGLGSETEPSPAKKKKKAKAKSYLDDL